jgi:hypothetical protein
MRRTRFLFVALLTALSGLTGVAFADTVGNNVDATVDATLETLSRNVADGPTTVKLRLVTNDNTTDLNGCNLGGGSGSQLRLTATSDATAVATVSQPADFTNCANNFTDVSPPAGSEQTVTVTPLATGCATISFAVDTANTVIFKSPNPGDQSPTFNVAPAAFKVSVGSGCDVPVDPCAGRTAPASAPTVTVNPASPDGTPPWYVTTTSFTVDPATNAEYSLDSGSTWSPYSAAVTLADGQHNVKARNFLSASTTPACPRLDGPASSSLLVKVDTVDPTVAITAPADDSTTLATSVDVAGTYFDATSGVAGVSVNGAAATLTDGTFSLSGVSLICGSNALEAVATDNAGNTSSNSVSIYRRCFTGAFQQPLDANGVLNKAKLGRVVPVKLTITANDGGSVPSPVYFGQRKISCIATAASDVVEEYAAGSSNLGNTFRLADGAWIYNLDTSKLPGAAVNSCYQLDIYVGGTVDSGIATGGVAVSNGSVRIQLTK